MMTEKELRAKQFPNIVTETHYRVWERRFIVAITEKERKRARKHMDMWYNNDNSRQNDVNK